MSQLSDTVNLIITHCIYFDVNGHGYMYRLYNIKLAVTIICTCILYTNIHFYGTIYFNILAMACIVTLWLI